jgi:hypothetical protein
MYKYRLNQNEANQPSLNASIFHFEKGLGGVSFPRSGHIVSRVSANRLGQK